MRCDGHDPAVRRDPSQDLGHAIARLVEMVLVADEKKVGLTRKHFDDMSDDGLSLDGNERLGDRVAGTPEAFAEP